MIKESDDQLKKSNTKLELITISAPFGGIQSSAHCGSTLLAWLSLGLTKPICQLITGSKYNEIPPNSDFITNPGPLIDSANRHLKIITDEKDTCRNYNSNGECIEDDYVFSMTEQQQDIVDKDNRQVYITVKAGHVEIVGDSITAPQKLISILQQRGVMNSTKREQANELTQLLKILYVGSRCSE